MRRAGPAPSRRRADRTSLMPPISTGFRTDGGERRQVRAQTLRRRSSGKGGQLEPGLDRRRRWQRGVAAAFAHQDAPPARRAAGTSRKAWATASASSARSSSDRPRLLQGRARHRRGRGRARPVCERAVRWPVWVRPPRRTRTGLRGRRAGQDVEELRGPGRARSLPGRRARPAWPRRSRRKSRYSSSARSAWLPDAHEAREAGAARRHGLLREGVAQVAAGGEEAQRALGERHDARQVECARGR